MRMPSALKSLDDKVLNRRTTERAEEPYPDEPRRSEREVVERQQKSPGGSTGSGLREALAIVGRVSALVLFALAAVLVLGILFVLAPTNPDNSVVELVRDVANAAAGPFRDVFTVSDDADREIVVNYALAALVYVIGATLVGKLGRVKG